MSASYLAPVDRADRIEVLDILRGFAILGIFYMNIPLMGASVYLAENDIRSIGWTIADRNTWAGINILLEGTQRGLLEMLFGAGMMVLARRAMEPDGPVGIADLYYRRNLWLIAFGLFDIFVLLWPGDILHVYGLAALLLFPFRRLEPRWLIAIGLLFAAFTAVGGATDFAHRTSLLKTVMAVEAKEKLGKPLTATDTDKMSEWQTQVDVMKLDKDEAKRVDAERQARTVGTSFSEYVAFMWGAWAKFVGRGSIQFSVFEAFCTMLLGVALWKLQVIQGLRSARFYAVLMIASYGYGLTARAVGVWEMFQFAPIAKTIWVNWEFARLAVVVGHIALINLVIKTPTGMRMLSPFKAAGRTAFSLYFMQQIVGLYVVFAPFGFGLWARYSYAGLAVIATAVIVAQLVIANIWMRFFATGPFEWLWRSLSYLEWQPFRIPRPSSTAQNAAAA